MKTLLILRGVPGSGKSTLASVLENMGAVVCTADDYFERDGTYKFDPTKLGAAHAACLKKCESSMSSGTQLIVVANTNTTESEVNVYIKAAKSSGYTYIVSTVENWHGGSNLHSVPDDKLSSMRNKLKNSMKL
jgi:predicted ABC-type ATPase